MRGPEQSLGVKNYSPYTKEQWAKIKKEWDDYKDEIGFEADFYLMLKNQEPKLDKVTIEDRMKEFRDAAEPLRQEWREKRT